MNFSLWKCLILEFRRFNDKLETRKREIKGNLNSGYTLFALTLFLGNRNLAGHVWWEVEKKSADKR